jgi:hypothetical protein
MDQSEEEKYFLLLRYWLKSKGTFPLWFVNYVCETDDCPVKLQIFCYPLLCYPWRTLSSPADHPPMFFSCLGNQCWFGLRKPPCQFLFGVCPCPVKLQIFCYLLLCYPWRILSSPADQCCGSESEIIRMFWLDPNPKKKFGFGYGFVIKTLL